MAGFMTGRPGGKEKSVGEGNGTTSWDVPLKGSTIGKVGKATKFSWSSYRKGSSSGVFLHLNESDGAWE